MHFGLKTDTKPASASIDIKEEKKILREGILPGELLLGSVAEGGV